MNNSFNVYFKYFYLILKYIENFLIYFFHQLNHCNFFFFFSLSAFVEKYINNIIFLIT